MLLCAKHYYNQRPLWNDEEVIFNSIEQFNTKEIFSRGLLSAQVFPRFYLFLIQSVAHPFDLHLLSLRLLPFISMMLAFFIWLKIGRYEFKEHLLYLTFVLSWTASVKMIYYAAELKQYSMDVLVSAIFIWFLYNQRRLSEEYRMYVFLLLALPFLGAFSYMAFLFIPIVFYNLMVRRASLAHHWWKRENHPERVNLSAGQAGEGERVEGSQSLEKKSNKENGIPVLVHQSKVWQNKNLIVYCLSFLIVGMLSYFFDIAVTDRTTVKSAISGYFISSESVYEFFNTLGNGTRNLFVRWFAETPRVIRKVATFFTAFGLIYMFFGFFKNIKKDRYLLNSLNTLAFILFLELCILGAFKKYPFTMPRTSLFFFLSYCFIPDH